MISHKVKSRIAMWICGILLVAAGILGYTLWSMEQENGDALSVSSGNDNNKTASKTDGEASADSEAGSSNTASATDKAGTKEEEASGDIVQEKPAAA